MSEPIRKKFRFWLDHWSERRKGYSTTCWPGSMEHTKGLSPYRTQGLSHTLPRPIFAARWLPYNMILAWEIFLQCRNWSLNLPRFQESLQSIT